MRFEHFVSPMVVGTGTGTIKLGVTPAAGPIADPVCVTVPRSPPGKTCLQTGRQHLNSPLDTL